MCTINGMTFRVSPCNRQRESDKVPEICSDPFLLTDFLFSLSPQIENLERELKITE